MLRHLGTDILILLMVLVITLLMMACPALAGDCCKKKKNTYQCYILEEEQQCPLRKKVVIVPKPETKIVYKTKWKTHVIEKPVVVPVEKKSRPNNSNYSARTGNQQVVIQVPRTRDRIYYKIKRRTKVVNVTKPNRLQLLVGLSATDHELHKPTCCDLKVKSSHEPDVGLQYLRDFGWFTGSVGATFNRNFYFGLGFNW